MKKTYMTPAMETIEVKTTGMLATSGGVEFNGGGGGSVTPQDGNATGDGLAPIFIMGDF